jgi:hypothetical protein
VSPPVPHEPDALVVCPPPSEFPALGQEFRRFRHELLGDLVV